MTNLINASVLFLRIFPLEITMIHWLISNFLSLICILSFHLFVFISVLSLRIPEGHSNVLCHPSDFCSIHSALYHMVLVLQTCCFPGAGTSVEQKDTVTTERGGMIGLGFSRLANNSNFLIF